MIEASLVSETGNWLWGKMVVSGCFYTGSVVNIVVQCGNKGNTLGRTCKMVTSESVRVFSWRQWDGGQSL